MRKILIMISLVCVSGCATAQTEDERCKPYMDENLGVMTQADGCSEQYDPHAGDIKGYIGDSDSDKDAK